MFPGCRTAGAFFSETITFTEKEGIVIMVIKKSISFEAEPIRNNAEYISKYVDLLYQRAVVGGMLAFAEQTSFQDVLGANERCSRDYDEYGVSNRNEMIAKLKTMKENFNVKEKSFLASLKLSDTSKFPMEVMAENFGFSRIEVDIIMLAFAVTTTSRFERLGRTSGFNSSRCDEVHDFLVMLAHSSAARLKLKPHFGPGSAIVQNDFISLCGRCETEGDFLRQDVEIGRRMVAQIQGITQPADSILAFSKLLTPTEDLDLVIYPEDKKQELLNLIRNRKDFQKNRVDWGLEKLVNYGFGTTILMSGQPGTGKTLMVHAVAKALGMKLLQVNVPALFQKGSPDDNFRLVMREGSLQEDTIVFFDEADEFFEDRRFNSMMPTILREFEKFSGVCILATNMKQVLDEALDRRILLKLDFDLPDSTARKAIWEKHLPKTLPLADDINTEELAMKFAFSGGYIKNAVVLACQRLALGKKGRKITQQDLINAAQTQRTSQLERLTERVVPNTKLENVILDDEQKEAVEDIIFEFRNKSKIFNDFGFKEIVPYGKATIAIFYGPSGSGKTMAAEAICHELGLNLLNVSPSHLVSKFVGESSKNIAELFKKARSEEAALMFDECESLFASRSDGSHNPGVERDNNQQTATLLRAIERFDGLVILTSNHVDGNNMDKAFARRIRHHVKFTAPGENLRAEIWKKHFPASAPLDKNVDFSALARDYEFSGGVIKQIALKSAFRAVKENSVITESIIRELCEFECGNNLVGYRKKTAQVGFGVK